MIFARIGHGPCYYHWNEVFAGVIQYWSYRIHKGFYHVAKMWILEEVHALEDDGIGRLE